MPVATLPLTPVWWLVPSFHHADYFNGYPTFVMSILGVGMATAVIGDIASHVGCCIGLKDSITAICIVALGTSVPGKIRHNSQGKASTKGRSA